MIDFESHIRIWTYTRHSSRVLVRDDSLCGNIVHPIHLAVWLGRSWVVDILMTAFPTSTSEVSRKGGSTLHLAAWHVYADDPRIMDILLNISSEIHQIVRRIL